MSACAWLRKLADHGQSTLICMRAQTCFDRGSEEGLELNMIKLYTCVMLD